MRLALPFSRCNLAHKVLPPGRLLSTLFKKSATMTTEPKVIRESVVHSEKWIKLKVLTYVDCMGKTRVWECAERTTGNGEIDAVAIFPILRKSGQPDRTLLVSQFRPPMNSFTIEMPAGLVDKGETAEQTAIRELKEETGYTASQISCSPIISNDAGMTTSRQKLAIAIVDLDHEANQIPSTLLDEGEYVETHLVDIDKYHDTLQEFSDKGYIVDSRVWYFAEALKLQATLRM
eukprot:TRINITY_DN443_c0_g1_i1.p1 TRINITY_DN443_c0_g1~~TRINITY_DN443_c0_g1_i1.p1  ORF type:complete len:233 (+),score=59.26 TRINITY_DN443_c0_g1_i1:3-701(+)